MRVYNVENRIYTYENIPAVVYNYISIYEYIVKSLLN